MIHIRKDLCAGCGFCAANCPRNAISIVALQAEVDRNRCDGCGICVDLCPRGAIVAKTPVSTGELHTEVVAMGRRTNDLIERIEHLKNHSS